MAERIADSVKAQLDSDDFSRRGFLGRSALAGGTLLAIGSGTGLAAGQEEGEGDAPADTAAFDDVAGTDIDVLNYALSLENLEDAFYQEALDTFSESEINEAVPEFSTSGDQTVYHYLETIGEHESTHVEVLEQTVTMLGGDPSPAGSYDFGIEAPADVLALGQVFENTGVAAYAGAAPFIESPDLQSAALSIHSVEARHAALLNGLNGESFFPNAFDEASSQADVLDAVSGFIADSESGGGTETPTDGGNVTENGTGQ
jgi:hypothetical protein